MKQYFENDIDLIDDEKTIHFEKDGINLKLKTNSGMFSKDRIDSYSIELVENIPIKEYRNLLDLGCGYGFIGIFLNKKMNVFTTFIDITARACQYTELNCQLNGVSDYKIVRSDGIKIADKFDLITLNPPIHAGKEIVYRLIEQAINSLSEKGSLYVVVHKKHGAKSLINDMISMNNSVEVVSKKKGLYILKINN